jgi:hypothetical protein
MSNAEHGLLQLSGEPSTWIWAFTCPEPKCACRTAVVLSAADYDLLRTRGRPIADAWLSGGDYARVAAGIEDVNAFAVDLDTRDVYPALGDGLLDLDADPSLKAVAERLDDDALDALARVWHLAKGLPVRPSPAEGGSKIEIEEWRAGDLVVWDETQPDLRSDTYVFGERIFDAFEHYCVEPDCACGEVVIDWLVTRPRGAPHPGRVEFDAADAHLRPDHERHRARLEELWAAFRKRHPRYRERFARRSAVMHALAGRIIAAPRRPKPGRNGACPCGSGKKYKKCCGAA